MSSTPTTPAAHMEVEIDASSKPAITPNPQDFFHFFPRLPMELRLKIWNFNLPPPRLVPIRCGAKTLSLSFSSHAHASPRPSAGGCTSYAAVPVNLHVCHESRAEAITAYRPSFGMTRNPGRIFFDPQRDVLYFGARDGYMASEAQFLTVMTLCDPADLADVRHLAINDSLFWVDSMYQSMSAANLAVEVLKQVRARMPLLERLVFVPRDENPVYDGQIKLVETGCLGPLGQRMARQMEAAMKAVCELYPDWKPPRWSIMALGISNKSGNYQLQQQPGMMASRDHAGDDSLGRAPRLGLTESCDLGNRRSVRGLIGARS